MKKRYTVTDVADRFEEAASTLRRLPAVHVQGYFNLMPEVIRTSVEIMQMEPEERRVGPPTAEAISRMEEVLDWIFYLEDEEERRLVWLRAERVYWKQICWRLGCGRTKAWQMWTYALLKITTRLNTRQSGAYLRESEAICSHASNQTLNAILQTHLRSLLWLLVTLHHFICSASCLPTLSKHSSSASRNFLGLAPGRRAELC